MSMTSKHRGSDIGGSDHRKNKKRNSKFKIGKITQEEIDEAVKLFLSKGGIITKQ